MKQEWQNINILKLGNGYMRIHYTVREYWKFIIAKSLKRKKHRFRVVVLSGIWQNPTQTLSCSHSKICIQIKF